MRSRATPGRLAGADHARRLAAWLFIAALASGCAERSVASSAPSAPPVSDVGFADGNSLDSAGPADAPALADAAADADVAADADAPAQDIADAEVAADPEVAAPADVSAAGDGAGPADGDDATDVSAGADIAADAEDLADSDADAYPEMLGDTAAPGDSAAPGDTAALGDTDALGDTAVLGDTAMPGDSDATTLPAPPTAVVWTGGFASQAPSLSALLSLPLGAPKPVSPTEWAPLSLGLLDDLNGDGAADLVVANQAGALAVAYGPLTAATKLKIIAAAGKAAIHSLAVLHRHGQPPLLLTGSAPIGAWQAQGEQWLQVATSTGAWLCRATACATA